MKHSLSISLLSLMMTSLSYGYGSQGHEGIAEYAHAQLSDETRQTVDTLLLGDPFVKKLASQLLMETHAATHDQPDGSPLVDVVESKIPVDNLGKIAIWADDLKFALRHHQGPLYCSGNQDAACDEGAEFNKNWGHNGDWHFLNLPLGTDLFVEKSFFNPDANNVVDAINGAINVLEGKQSGYQIVNPDGSVTDFTQLQALRLIVHFVGDLHQPLHVGTGFYKLPSANGSTTIDVSNADEILISNPDQVSSANPALDNDSGGNDIGISDTNKAKELHAYWDTDLVQNYAGGKNTTAHDLATQMLSRAPDINKYADAEPDYHQWVAAWATDSVHQSQLVYKINGKAIRFKTATLNSKNHLNRISATLPEGYATLEAPVAAAQLEKAGSHLALLLNHIQWKIKDPTVATTNIPVCDDESCSPQASNEAHGTSPSPAIQTPLTPPTPVDPTPVDSTKPAPVSSKKPTEKKVFSDTIPLVRKYFESTQN